MFAELGHFCLVLALATALVQSTLPLIGAARRDGRLMAIADSAARVQFLAVLLAFAALTLAFVTSDFSLRVVTANSHSLKPMLYKVAGVWGNHEGSLLLWVLALTGFGMAVSLFGGGLPTSLRARVLGVQGLIGLAFLSFLLFTSNPFDRLAMPPLDGDDLNPLLQDPGLAFHPPFLYLGYVGLSVAFSFAVAAMLEGKVDAAWGRWVRPWTLAAWIFLTIGIALGSWWAYYELGWGGFWFWDPVENASLMPWLFAAALLHSAIVVEKRESLKAWTVLLAILAFGFSLIGTFLVRSGVITSVHAFANDPERGVYILAILGVFMGGALILFALRSGVMEARGAFSLISRESALVTNNLLLAVASMVVFIGTIWPLVAEMAFGRTLSVGAPFFNAAFTPFFVLLALILPLGSILPWKRGQIAPAFRTMLPALVLALALLGLAFAVQTGGGALGPIGVGLGSWVMAAALLDLWGRTGRGAASARLARLRRLPRADFGKAVAHFGLGAVILAAATVSAWTTEVIRTLNVGESFQIGSYEVRLASVHEVQGPNYTATQGALVVSRGGAELETLLPEKRVYPAAGMPTTEAAIRYRPFEDLYLVLGDPQPDGSHAIRAYVKPFANWLWAGAGLMALGGLLSLSDRRHRIAAGAAKPARVAPQPAE